MTDRSSSANPSKPSRPPSSTWPPQSQSTADRMLTLSSGRLSSDRVFKADAASGTVIRAGPLLRESLMRYGCT